MKVRPAFVLRPIYLNTSNLNSVQPFAFRICLMGKQIEAVCLKAKEHEKHN